MRGLAAILTTYSLLVASAWSAETSFPYTAKVSVDEVEVRCGPGWDYYPTMRLKRGAAVDVYRHEPGGWLAIRPPQRSFSWIPARQVKRDPGARVGKVVIDGAVAWVGSAATSVQQYKWQVRLERDELVEILGEQSLSVGPGFATETYLQIAPPAGEFRWIHAENAVAPQALAHRSSGHTIELTDYTTQSSTPTSTSPPNASQANDASNRSSNNTSATAGKTDQELDAMKQQVDQLKLDLAVLVSLQIDQWDLNSLRQRASTLAQSAKGTPLARQVRLISYRIGEFETLQQRHQRMAENPSSNVKDPRIEQHGVSSAPQSAPTETGRSETNRAQSDPTQRDTAPSDVQLTSWQQEIENALDSNQVVGTGIDRLAAGMEQSSPQFDAEGWLMPVHSSRRIAPPFALLDDDGRVICYVAPSPGLNLRRYSKKYVGLFGEKKHMSDLRASLLTATRVVKRKD